MSHVARLISSIANWFGYPRESNLCPHGFYPLRDGVCPYCLNHEPAFILAADEDDALAWLDFMSWHPMDVVPITDWDIQANQLAHVTIFLAGDWHSSENADRVLDALIDEQHMTFFRIDQFGSIHQIHEDIHAEARS